MGAGVGAEPPGLPLTLTTAKGSLKDFDELLSVVKVDVQLFSVSFGR